MFLSFGEKNKYFPIMLSYVNTVLYIYQCTL